MNEKAKEIIRKILFLICLCIFICSLYNIYLYLADYNETKETIEGAQEMVQIEMNQNPNDVVIEDPKPIVINRNHWIDCFIQKYRLLEAIKKQEDLETPEPEIPQIEPLPEPEIPLPMPPIVEEPVVDIYKALKIKIEVDWNTLKSEAKHLVGWLYIPDTNINYPLVQHPTDNQYYLDRNHTGKWNGNGSIFVRKETSLDSKHPIIYGHRMKADIMFHRILFYRDQEYADAHKYIYIVTEQEIRVYQVFSVVYSDYWENHFTWEFGEDYELTFMEYIEQEIKNSIVKTNVRPITENDTILSLSTCSGRSKANRIIVHAVLLTTYTNKELTENMQDMEDISIG